MNLTPSAINVLKALATYQYLTASLIEQAGIATYRTTRDNLLPQLVNANKQGLVNRKRFGYVAGKGSVQHVYWLNRHGAKLLANIWGVSVGNVFYPKNGVQFGQSYCHCLGLVSFHIQLNRWIEQTGQQLITFDRYFDRVPHPDLGQKQKISASTVFYPQGHITPDAIFKYHTINNERLCAVEVQHGNYTGQIISQFEKYIPVFKNKSISTRYGYDKCPFVLSLFDSEKTMLETQQWFLSSNILKPALKGFLFNTLDNIKQDITQHWHMADDTTVQFFSNPESDRPDKELP
jgi:hypothetical protein